MANFAIVIALLTGAGLLFVRSKSAWRGFNVRWVGYTLLIMTAFLVVIAILAKLNEASHYP